MGLIDDLGYGYKPPNGLQRAIQTFGSSRFGSWILSKSLRPVDHALFTLSGGRLTFPGAAAALPVIMVTMTGAKTGETRTVPLLGIPVGDNLAIVGSNFSQKPTPAWTYNLEVNPSAIVSYRDKRVEVVAHEVDEDELDRMFELADAVTPGYARYRARANHRVFRVFVLEPVD